MKLAKKKSIQNLALLPILGLMCTSPSQASNNEIIDQLKSCARIEQDANRITCYDQLGKSVLADETQPPVEMPSTANQVQEVEDEVGAEREAEVVTAEVLPDTLGGGNYTDKAGIKVESHRGRVTSCKKASDRKWFYIFENGQVWKQVDSRKRRHKNCDFLVTVTKDSFGYKMVIDGQDSKIRIDRRR